MSAVATATHPSSSFTAPHFRSSSCRRLCCRPLPTVSLVPHVRACHTKGSMSLTATLARANAKLTRPVPALQQQHHGPVAQAPAASAARSVSAAAVRAIAVGCVTYMVISCVSSLSAPIATAAWCRHCAPQAEALPASGAARQILQRSLGVSVSGRAATSSSSLRQAHATCNSVWATCCSCCGMVCACL